MRSGVGLIHTPNSVELVGIARKSGLRVMAVMGPYLEEKFRTEEGKKKVTTGLQTGNA